MDGVFFPGFFGFLDFLLRHQSLHVVQARFIMLKAILVAALALTVSAFVPNHPSSHSTNLKMSSETDAPTVLDPSETALVLIEYQNEFTSEGGKFYDAVKECMDATSMLDNSRKVMDIARDAGCTIIHCPISFEKGHKEISSDPYGILAGVKEGEAFTAGEWGAQICPEMTPQSSDLVVKGKSGLCGFASTNLDFLLRQNGIKNVVLGGFLTNW